MSIQAGGRQDSKCLGRSWIGPATEQSLSLPGCEHHRVQAQESQAYTGVLLSHLYKITAKAQRELKHHRDSSSKVKSEPSFSKSLPAFIATSFIFILKESQSTFPSFMASAPGFGPCGPYCLCMSEENVQFWTAMGRWRGGSTKGQDTLRREGKM